MASNVAHFAIHADDVERAREFYEAVFSWRFEPWGPPGFYRVHTGDVANPGIEGALHERSEPNPGTGMRGFLCSTSVDDVDDIRARVIAAGGTISMEKVNIPSVGLLIEFHDTEGNVVQAMQYEARPWGG